MTKTIHENIAPSSLFRVDALKQKDKVTFFPRNDQRTKLAKACLYDDYKQVIYLIETEKVDINGKADDGKTPLMYAIYNKNKEIAQYLCDNGADINITDDKGNTPLNYAITMAPDIATYLIMNGANIHIKNVCDEYPIHFASMQGDLVIIEMLFERGAELNVFNYNKHSPLMMASGNKQFKAVKYLVKNGADINATDNNYDCILHGCIYNDLYDILLFLLNNKNNKVVNERNYKNETPLIYAVRLNKPEYVELLLKYGADPNVCDVEGNIPLIVSCKRNNYEMSKLLLKYGANVNLYFSWSGYCSPLYYALKNKNPDIMQLCFDYKSEDLMFCFIELDNYNDFEKLLGPKSINDKNKNGDTLLFFAAHRNKLNFVKLLLENGADPNVCNHKCHNESPLYQAVMNRNYEMVKVLIEYKANYNHRLTVNAFVGPKLGESIYGKADRYCWTSEICDYLKSLNAELFYEWD